MNLIHTISSCRSLTVQGPNQLLGSNPHMIQRPKSSGWPSETCRSMAQRRAQHCEHASRLTSNKFGGTPVIALKLYFRCGESMSRNKMGSWRRNSLRRFALAICLGPCRPRPGAAQLVQWGQQARWSQLMKRSELSMLIRCRKPAVPIALPSAEPRHGRRKMHQEIRSPVAFTSRSTIPRKRKGD